MHRCTRVPIGDHSSIWADLNVPSTIKTVVGNPPDWAEMQAWRRILRPGDLFIDVGASAGYYTIWAADLGARVVAVEPDPVARQLLERNLSLNHYTGEVIPAALGTLPGTTSFTTALGSMNRPVPDTDGVPNRLRPKRTREVPVRTLDDVLAGRRARGIKVDVEEAERLVLEGATGSLTEGRLPFLQLEWYRMSLPLLGEDRAPVADLLRGHGYSFYRPDNAGRLHLTDESLLGPDIFAVLGDVDRWESA